MVASASQLREAKASHHRLRELVSDLILLSYSPQSDSQVVPQFLQQMAEALNASYAAFWSLAENQEMLCMYEHCAPCSSSEVIAAQRPDKQTIAKYARLQAGGVVPASSKSHLRNGLDQQNNLTPIVVPVLLSGVPIGAIEILTGIDLPGNPQSDVLTFVRHMARVLGHRSSMRRDDPKPNKTPISRISEEAFSSHAASPAAAPAACQSAKSSPERPGYEKRYREALLALHESLNLESTAFVIANEFRQLLRCDRVSVVICRNSSCEVLAVSGQEAINRRADVVRHLETLAKLALNEASNVWMQRDAADRPAQFIDAVEEYKELSAWEHLGIIPLRLKNMSSTDYIAFSVLIVEKMKPLLDSETTELAARVAPHAAQALVNALEQEQIFLLSLWKGIGRLRHRLISTPRSKLITATTGLFIGATFLSFFPVNFNIQGSGSLQPVSQRDVFAEVEGVVTKIHVEHGDIVRQGDVLLELRNTDLDVQIADILGQQRTVQEQLASIQRMRHVDHISREEETRLSGQLLQLQEKLKGLGDQQKLLHLKKERLIVRSPMAGQISTWNVHRQLMLRPVSAGQALLTVADSAGPWNLEVYLPESEAGHLLCSKASTGQSVEYMVASQPTITHSGKVVHVDDTAQMYDESGHALRVLVDIDKSNVPITPAGTTVTARISCGHKSIGYVWLHRLVDFVHARILFPLF